MTIALLVVACNINMIMIIIDDSSSIIYDHSNVASGLYFKHIYDHNWQL
jgi:hypothetical protein